MTLDTVQQLIIAYAPSITAIITCIVSVVAAVRKMTGIRRSFEDRTKLDSLEKNYEELSALCNKLNDEAIRSRKEAKFWRNKAQHIYNTPEANKEFKED